SRGLIGLLVVTITIGLISYFHNTSRSKATEAPKVSEAVVAPPVIHPEPVGPATQPIIAPTTEPSTFLAKSAPATQPVFHAGTERSVAADPIASDDPISDAKSRIGSDDLLTARKILNEALLSSKFSESDTTVAKQLLGQINQSIVFSSKRFA